MKFQSGHDLIIDKCYLEFENCEKDYDCIQCEVARKYWASLSLGLDLKNQEYRTHQQNIPSA